jgi:hypothetical protein
VIKLRPTSFSGFVEHLVREDLVELIVIAIRHRAEVRPLIRTLNNIARGEMRDSEGRNGSSSNSSDSSQSDEKMQE